MNEGTRQVVGVALCAAGAALAVVSTGWLFTWPLGVVAGVALAVGGWTLRTQREARPFDHAGRV
jgi:uncharacterized membrane protein YccC